MLQAAANLREEYPDLPEENVVVRESAQATIDRLKDGSGMVFLGFKECPWCQKLLPIANEAAAAEGEKVYYLDIKAAREANSSEYLQLVAILSPYLQKDENGQPRISVPDVSIVKDGEIIGRHEMESTSEVAPTPDDYWTKERRERAGQKLRTQLHSLKKEVKNEWI